MKIVQRHIAPLILALLISMVPHLTVLPPWVILWCLTSWGIIFLRLKAGRDLPGKGLCLLLILGGTTAVFLGSGGGLDRFPGISLLWIMAGIKMMEIQSRRDAMVMVLLTYFLTASILFFDTGGRKGLLLSLAVAAGLMGLIAGFYAARFLKTAVVRDDDVRRTYRLYCCKLARVGLVRSPSQGPLDFAAVVSAARQDLKGGVATIVGLYIRLRYDRRRGSEDLKRFKLAVRQFKS